MNERYQLEYGSRFVKDLKLAKRRGFDLAQLKAVTDMLQDGIKLPANYRDHLLTGNYGGYRECHINPDWLLIYSRKDTVRIISLYRTGTHSDLF
ncbi:MAG: type II toxin-antitoxin system YafQ family toxin [Bacteroidales bacterium]|nr:type II toxin-antitoxin system YafQ family toxin [Bacteroidales bacterium]